MAKNENTTAQATAKRRTKAKAPDAGSPIDELQAKKEAIEKAIAALETLSDGDRQKILKSFSGDAKPVTPKKPVITKPKSRGPKIPKVAIQEALEASMVGNATPEHKEVLSTLKAEPEKTLGVSKRAFKGLQQAHTAVHGDDQEMILVAKALILCGLPYKSTTDTHYVREAKVSHGKVRLTITATDPDVPLPFGKDRVTLAWVTTRALRQGNPVVSWESSAEFFDVMRLDKGGKSYRKFAESWKRLSRATFTVQFFGEGHERGHQAPIFEEWDLPSLRDDRDECMGLTRLPGMGYSVTLGARLWAHLQESPVPLRLEVMREFQDEPKSWDFVGFVCWRSWACEQAKADGVESPTAYISFNDLQQQLGSVDKNHKQLRKSLKSILERLGVIWPEMQARFIRAGVLEIGAPLNGVHPVKVR